MKPLFSKVLFVAALLVRTAAYTASSQTTTLPDAHGAYFTGTPQGHLVMSGMEGDAQEEKSLLKVAVSEDQGRTFSPAVCVPATRGASTAHGECPPKVAFRADGTVVVMYRLS